MGLRKKQLQNWHKDDLVKQLRLMNFKYGQLANKYATLKFEKEKLEEQLNSEKASNTN